MLRVNETYGPVAQGEGKNLGMPVFFLRLAGCNLHCAFRGSICDTNWTWNYEGTVFKNEKDFPDWVKKVKIEDEVHEESVEEVYANLMDLKDKHQICNLVVSGGEPLMQQAELAKLLEKLKADGWFIEIETNGTWKPTEELERNTDQYNVSPKLRSSGNEDILRLRIPILTWFAANPKAVFKFVVTDQGDVAEVDNIVHETEADPDRVYLMPVGHDRKTLDANEKPVYELALKKGYRFTTRLHIRLFDNLRAV